jgi:glutamate synthase domain-containing protein 2
MKPKEIFFAIATSIIIITFSISIVWKPILWTLIITVPLILLGISDVFNKKHAIKNNFPVIGHLRYLLESFRPEIQQYFVETETEGMPINRMFRSLIYQRAKDSIDTTPFGTKMDVYRVGYEWMNHSIYAKSMEHMEHDPRVVIGSKSSAKPYNASILNISAMSFGALSQNAVLAMNKGAKIGGFAQNTGEGGISPYHLEHGGDLIWQVGTGYFGCRTHEGDFCPDTFAKRSQLESVKMIEIKLSQGAKPGHGGILPAIKNTLEISKIRDVKPFKAVHSPPYHKAFSDAEGLLNLVSQMRKLSGGKPVGFKLCVGSKSEFEDICKAMVKINILPDFITVDGGEGGTGAAPVEFSNSLGMPLREGLCTVNSLLIKYALRNDIKIIASGKILTAFHMARVFALGADLCNSARAMMMAVGCIQALQCNTNTCPVGVATQNKSLMKGLNVEDKATRVKSYHEKTVEAFQELLAASGLSSQKEITKKHIYRRTSSTEVKTYQEIYN